MLLFNDSKTECQHDASSSSDGGILHFRKGYDRPIPLLKNKNIPFNNNKKSLFAHSDSNGIKKIDDEAAMCIIVRARPSDEALLRVQIIGWNDMAHRSQRPIRVFITNIHTAIKDNADYSNKEEDDDLYIESAMSMSSIREQEVSFNLDLYLWRKKQNIMTDSKNNYPPDDALHGSYDTTGMLLEQVRASFDCYSYLMTDASSHYHPDLLHATGMDGILDSPEPIPKSDLIGFDYVAKHPPQRSAENAVKLSNQQILFSFDTWGNVTLGATIILDQAFRKCPDDAAAVSFYNQELLDLNRELLEIYDDFDVRLNYDYYICRRLLNCGAVGTKCNQLLLHQQ